MEPEASHFLLEEILKVCGNPGLWLSQEKELAMIEHNPASCYTKHTMIIKELTCASVSSCMTSYISCPWLYTPFHKRTQAFWGY